MLAKYRKDCDLQKALGRCNCVCVCVCVCVCERESERERDRESKISNRKMINQPTQIIAFTHKVHKDLQMLPQQKNTKVKFIKEHYPDFTSLQHNRNSYHGKSTEALKGSDTEFTWSKVMNPEQHRREGAQQGS